MIPGELTRLLARFLLGEVELDALKDSIDERLFVLRQRSEMTPEKKLLSKLQLYLHEAEEGLRPEFDIYALVQSTVDQVVHVSTLGEEANPVRESLPPPTTSRTPPMETDSEDKTETISLVGSSLAA